MIEREARVLAGYRAGKRISNELMDVLEASDANTVDQNVKAYLDEHADPRLTEIVNTLMRGVMMQLTGGEPQGACHGCR